ncbi:MAG: hypothetical protein LBM67_08410 [Lentimicrobiaceae bacterium]|jgi:hypothetical protein|nr:hypothetical protein [Lentimicrobiaceae bacterium]
MSKVVWYKKGTNEVQQELGNFSGEIEISQLNNVLLIRDGDIISKHIFDNEQNKYLNPISDLPALPNIKITTESYNVLDRSAVEKVMKIASQGTKIQAGSTAEDDVNRIKAAADFDYTHDNPDSAWNCAAEIINLRKEGSESDEYFFIGQQIQPQDLEDYKKALIGKYNLLVKSKPKFYHGYIFLSYAFELFDGSITKPTPPICLYLGDKFSKDFLYVSKLEDNDEDDDNLVDRRVKVFMTNGNVLNRKREEQHNIRVESVKIQFDTLDYNKDIIKSVVLYASEPIAPYDFENMRVDQIPVIWGYPISIILPIYPPPTTKYEYADIFKGIYQNYSQGQIRARTNISFSEDRTEALQENKLKTEDLDNVILYKVKSFLITKDTPKEYQLDLTALTTNQNMPVDASGWWNAAGDMFVYNQRLHLYNYIQTFKKDLQLFKNQGHKFEAFFQTSVTAEAIINTDNQMNKIIQTAAFYVNVVYDTINQSYSILIPQYLSFPDSRCEQINLYFKIGDKIYVVEVKLSPSKVQNLAQSADIDTSNIQEDHKPYHYVLAAETDLTELPTQKDNDLVYTNNTNIIVSAINNPMYFPVSQSYNAGAEIITMAVNAEQISDTQTGDYPLFVFTKEFIRALTIGQGEVLYDSFVPISSEIAINKNILQLRAGIMFVAKSGLKIINGRNITDISEPLEERERDIATQGLIKNFFIANLSDLKPNCLSDVVFQKYLDNAAFGFDINNNEIIIANPNFNYSFIFEISTATYHKIDKSFFYIKDTDAIIKNNSSRDVVDIENETKINQNILITLRALRLSQGFSKLLRSFARGKLNINRGFAMGTMRSDDLRNWRGTSVVTTSEDSSTLGNYRAREQARFFSFILSGQVKPNFEIEGLEIEFEEKIDKRLR